MSTYQIDTAHSAAQFKVRHMMIANVKGEFDKVTGTVNFDPANPAASTVEASNATRTRRVCLASVHSTLGRGVGRDAARIA